MTHLTEKESKALKEKQEIENKALKEKQEIENKALKEKQTLGTVNVRCPKCKNHPTVKITGKNIKHPDRIDIQCTCGYLSQHEIYL